MLNWAGVHSLEIYLTHYLFLSLVPATSMPFLVSIDGLMAILVNYVLTLVLTLTAINLAQRNSVMNCLLYAKNNWPHG